MSEKLEYDSQLGGEVVLPDHVPTYRYAASCLDEIRQLVAETMQPTGSKLIFQTLPKHMRRRAMSHNPKRLPRKYRRIHVSQQKKSGELRISKRPSRKHRRRPKNLLQDYLRRQRRNAWLETHIWHARRFHMIDRWGYRLAHYSCDKTFRACYRAGAEHCLVQDISYYVCFQLTGKLSFIYEGFLRLSHKAQTVSSSLTIKAKTYINGQREGFIDLYRDRQYPLDALCRASFLWRPLKQLTDINDKPEDLERTLWLWVHPCVYKDILNELIKVFEQEVDETCDVTSDKDETLNMEMEKDKTTLQVKELHAEILNKAIAHTCGKRYRNLRTGTILIDLKDAMNRFRLTGPLSQSVLNKAFKIKNLPTLQVEKSSQNSQNWFQRLSNADAHFQAQHNAQQDYWEKCKFIDSPTYLLPNLVLGLNIIDPRLQRPSKRTKALPEVEDSLKSFKDFSELLKNIPKSLSDSPIWDANVRQHVRKHMMDTHTWCQLREKHALVPGGNCAFEEKMQAIPVLIIQRPGQQENNMRLNYGCGWDVIVPAGYGLSFWLTFIMWGAKPGGLREIDTLAREMGRDVHLPDTVVGLQIAESTYAERREKYFKLPQAKRCNYNKLAIVSPFRTPWNQLIRDWQNEQESRYDTQTKFFVLRDHMQLGNLSAALLKGDFLKPPENAIIQVRLSMCTRGNIDANALICLPTYGDIKTNFKRRFTSTNNAIYLEPNPPDLNQKERKRSREQHKKELKRLRRQRYRKKKKQQETSETRVRISPAETATLVAAQALKMQKLWLPQEACETLYSVRKQCSREAIGYVTNAGFSYSASKVCAVGYIASNGLKQLICFCQKFRLKQLMCLVRDINSPQYYFASINVAINP